MKRLLLIRHAKSSWEDLALRDFDRDLNKRGQSDAPEMGRRLLSRGLVPDAFVASTARRARATAELLAAELGFPAEEIDFRDELYLSSPAVMLDTVRQTPKEATTLALVAHNPGITELANQLSDSRRIDNMPTCAVAIFELPIEDWSQMGRQAGREAQFVDFDYPKRDD